MNKSQFDKRKRYAYNDDNSLGADDINDEEEGIGASDIGVNWNDVYESKEDVQHLRQRERQDILMKHLIEHVIPEKYSASSDFRHATTPNTTTNQAIVESWQVW